MINVEFYLESDIWKILNFLKFKKSQIFELNKKKNISSQS